VLESDVFILLSDEAGTSMYVELGAAIAHRVEFGKPLIYVIGDYISRSMYFFHHTVIRLESIEHVIKDVQERYRKQEF